MLTLLAALACGQADDPAPETPETPAAPKVDERAATLQKQALGLYKPLPEVMADAAPSKEMVDLGRTLYFDPRLSKNHDVSCNSCHGLDTYGVDGAKTSTGHKQQLGGRNAPTVYNAAVHLAQFWDGREPDVEAQAKGPPLNPIEMAMPDAAACDTVLQSIPGYKPMFEAAFPGQADPVNFDNFAVAVGAFERTLVTPSPWDAFLGGDLEALSSEQLDGFEAFTAAGCQACHNGVGMGGGSYQKLGAAVPYETADMGRFDVTGNEADKMVFKTPSLRNITQTAPYFHDGEVATLEEAVTLMGKHQLGKDLSEEEVAKIITFLGALEGPLPPAEHIAKPELPESGPDTPAPDPS